MKRRTARQLVRLLSDIRHSAHCSTLRAAATNRVMELAEDEADESSTSESTDDTRDGFIHFSTALQVAETARKHFFGQTGLFLVEVDADELGDALRWEPSRNDELFPHLYGELDLGTVTAVYDMHARPDGYHDIPELTP